MRGGKSWVECRVYTICAPRAEYPQFFESGNGCRVKDVDGNEYIGDPHMPSFFCKISNEVIKSSPYPISRRLYV